MRGKYHLSLLLLILLAGCSGDPSAPVPARLALSHTTLDFGPVVKGMSLVLRLVVRNTGESETRVAALTIDGEHAASFAVVNPSSFAIGPGEEGGVEVRFSPLDPGRHSARLWMIGGNDDTLTVSLAGLGTGSVIAGLVDSPPRIDGDPGDPVWNVAIPFALRFEQVAVSSADPFSSASRRSPFTGSLRAVYTADSLYLALSWDDPTADLLPDVWELADTGWNRSKPGQDGASLIFPIGSGVERFDREGCAVSCHATSSLDRYEEGHRPDKGSIDIWYWNAGSSDALGIAWDQWADAVAGGRRPDRAGDRPEPNYSSSSPLPLRAWGAGNGTLDPRRFLWKPGAIPFDPDGVNPRTGNVWQRGDSIPGWMLLPVVQGADQVRARGIRRNGGWSVEFARALTTSEATDIQFDVRQPSYFSIATHDRQKKFSPEEYAALPSAPNPSHYGVYLIGLIFD